jgi:hypothetical protein
MAIRHWVIAATLIEITANPLSAAEWRYFSPILSSQTRDLRSEETRSLLANFCLTPIHNIVGIGQTCSTRELGKDFANITDHTFHPRGVIFGHFLGPDTEDAAVSGWSAETHPYLGGGTLLLSRRDNRWIPVWYRSAVIIDACEKIELPNRREILLCEDEDSGMGHALHYLYTVDLEHPSDLRHSPLAIANSYKDDCVQQSQVLKGIRWSEDRHELYLELETTEWKRVSTEAYCANYPTSRPANLHLTFVITAQGLRSENPGR